MKLLCLFNYVMWVISTPQTKLEINPKLNHSSKEVISSKDSIIEEFQFQPLDFVATMPRFVPPNPLPIDPPLVTDVNPPIKN